MSFLYGKKMIILFIDAGDKVFKQLYSFFKFTVKQPLDEFSLTANLGPKDFKKS
jgi:hypothetical protein